MSSGLSVYNNKKLQFSSKYPALIVDRTKSYGYGNYKIIFTTNPPMPPDPTGSSGATTSISKDLLIINHNLGYIPAFETLLTGYGLPSTNGGIFMWNEDALITLGVPGTVLPGDTLANNTVIFRTDNKNLYVRLIRQSGIDYDGVIKRPVNLSGVELDINVQIFAMGLDDVSSRVL